MALDPLSVAAGEALVGELAKASLDGVRRILAARGSQYADLAGRAGIEAELDGALAVLAGDAQSLPQEIVQRLRGFATGRPSSFADADARLFIDDPRVRPLVKAGARKTVANKDVAEEQAAARAIHGQLFDGDGWFGETLYDEAVRYSVFVLVAHLTPADRFVVDILLETQAAVLSGIAVVQQALGPMAEQLTTLARASSQGGLTVDRALLSAAVEAETRRLRRLRFALGDTQVPRAEALAARLEAGLGLADDSVKAAAYQEIATIFCRAKRPDAAEPFIAKAAALGTDTACERARVALVTDDIDEAMRLLRDREDRVSRGLLVDAVQRQDGEAAARQYFADHFAAADVTGHALHAAAFRIGSTGDYAEAEALLAAATEEQIDENPVLLFARGRLRIAAALPSDLVAHFLENEGMIAQPGDLRDDAEGQAMLIAARDDFRRLSAEISDADAPDLAMFIDINRLFLEMSSGSAAEREAGRAAFAARLADPAEAARFAPLARLFGIAVDKPAIRKRLARAEQLGGYDDAELTAAFSLVMEDGSAQEIIAFLQKYRGRLGEYQSPVTILSIEIEAHARSGDVAGARALLNRKRNELGSEASAALDAAIVEAEGGDALAARLALYEASGSTHDLQLLVGALSDAEDDRLGDYLLRLWHARHQLGDAARACDAFVHIGQEERAEALLEDLGEAARSTPALHIHLAWARQRQGRLAEAKTELDAIRATGAEDGNIRQLRILLAVESGQWAELVPFVRDELAAADRRSAKQLLEAARIAQAVDSSEAMPLARAAIAKAPNDPHLAMGGYSIAVAAGLDRTPEAAGWLRTARANSDAEGPVLEKQFEEIVEIVKAQRERAEKVSAMVTSAQLPFFVAMQPVGGTLSALVIRQLADNAELADSRQKLLFPLFAGNRIPIAEFDPQSIAFDPIALLLLDYLGLLPRALAAFDDVMLPAGTLHSFFEDRVKAGPPQPSRVLQARAIKDKIANGLLQVEELPPGIEAEGCPEEDAGEEFAALYSAASARDGYVVDTAPLQRPSAPRESVDPAPYRDRLLSPTGLTEALLEMGVISNARANAMRPHVAGVGPWPDEPGPLAGRPLFLSVVAVQYLSDAGLLPILKQHAGALIVRRDVAGFADQEIAAADMAASIGSGIERVRDTLAGALAAGRARVGPTRPRRDEADDGGERIMGPVMSMLRDHGGVQAFVCDDRAMNKYGQSDDGRGNALPFLTTTDIIDILHRRGLVSDEERTAAREALRVAGAGLMPIDNDELFDAVRTSNWKVGPNAELRAIRDSIHLPIARAIVQLPQERAWLQGVSFQLGFAIRRIWQELEDSTAAARAASYLLDIIPDAASVSAADDSSDRAVWVQNTHRQTLWAFASIFDLEAERAEAYRTWFSGRVAPAAERRDPGAIEAVGRTLFSILGKPVPLDEEELGLVPGEEQPSAEAVTTALLRQAITRLPEEVGAAMLRDPAVLTALDLPTEDFVGLWGLRFDRAKLFAFLRALVNGESATLTSYDGTLAVEEARIDELGVGTLTANGDALRFPNIGTLSTDPAKRDAAIDAIARFGEMSSVREGMWRDAVAQGPLDDMLFLALELEVAANPEAHFRDIHQAITDGSAIFENLVPSDAEHFAALFGMWPPPATLGAYKTAWREMASELDAPRLKRLLRLAAPLACLAGGIIGEASDRLAAADRFDLVQYLASRADPFSLAAAFEVASRHGDQDDDMRALADALRIRVFNFEDSVLTLSTPALGAAVAMTTALSARNRTFGDWPLYAQRLVRFVHASHLVRITQNANLDLAAFAEKVGTIYGSQARLTQLYELRETPHFQPHLFSPALVHTIMIDRAAEAIERIDENARPKEWTAARDAALAAAIGSQYSFFLLAVGPFDEFEDSWPGREELSSENAEANLGVLQNGNDKDSIIGELLKLSVAFEVPADKRADVGSAIVALDQRFAIEDYTTTAEIGLQLAARWRDESLADRLIDKLVEYARSGDLADIGGAPRFILLAAAATADRQQWLERAGRVAQAFAHAQKKRNASESLSRAIKLLGDFDTEIAVRLASAAAYTRLA